MEARITRLGTICRIGAVADLVFAVAMLVPPLWGWLFGIADYSPTLQHRLDIWAWAQRRCWAGPACCCGRGRIRCNGGV